MTEVSFHSKVADPLLYVCRLLRKALRKGSRLVVTAEPGTLARLDRTLWTFDPLEFVPHVRVVGNALPGPRLQATPVWLVEPGAPGPAHDVLVNLGPGVAPGFESFGRVLEIVGLDPQEIEAGRARWRHYTERGYAIVHHEAGPLAAH